MFTVVCRYQSNKVALYWKGTYPMVGGACTCTAADGLYEGCRCLWTSAQSHFES